MGETVAVLIGALIATFPGIISTILDSRRLRRQQKHDLELRSFDLYASARFEAIQDYAQELTRFIIHNFDAQERHTAWCEYVRAYERASVLVSTDTRRLMRAAYGKLIPELSGRATEYLDMGKALTSPEYDALLAALHRELFSPLQRSGQYDGEKEQGGQECEVNRDPPERS